MSAPPLWLDVAGLHVQRSGRTVLQSVSMQLHEGQRLALVGPSGVGKSSLLHALVGLLPARADTLSWFGRPCRNEADFAAARREVALLFQSSDDQLLCPRVIDDVAFGPLNLGLGAAEALQAARSQLQALRIEHLQERPVHELSGGEARLVALAGVLAMQPRVLLLDEPTTGLDEDSASRMLAHLAAQQQALIVATHDATLIQALRAEPWPLSPAGGTGTAGR